MKIRYVTGDVTEATQRIIAHGCNAKGVMGSGVAKAIREKFPLAYTDYRERFEKHGLLVGEVQVSACSSKFILNCITQENYGRDPNTVYFKYVGWERVIDTMNAVAETLGATEIAMPKIGSGLANGKWEIISQMLEDGSKTFTPVVYIP